MSEPAHTLIPVLELPRRRPARWDNSHWRDQAACATRETALFFPVGHTQKARRLERSAKAVCAVCPVRSECLEFALLTLQNDGVWGGLSEDERRAVRRSRRRAAAASRYLTGT